MSMVIQLHLEANTHLADVGHADRTCASYQALCMRLHHSAVLAEAAACPR